MIVEARRPASDALTAAAVVSLALAAPLFAASTWQVEYTPLVARDYAVVIICVEWLVIALSVASGFHPIRAFDRMAMRTRWALLIWLIAVAVAASAAELRTIAAIHAATTVTHALFAFVLWERLSTRWQSRGRDFLWAIALGAASYAILVVILMLTVLGDPDFLWVKFGAGVSNVRQIGFYGVALVGVSVGLLATETGTKGRWVQWAMLLAGYYLVNASGGRAAFGAALASSVLVILLARKRARASAAVRALAAFVAAGFVSLLFAPGPGWGILVILGRLGPSPEVDMYLSGRLEMWTQTAGAILERPIFGHGQGQFRWQVTSASGTYNHPHNSILQALYDWGAVGTAALGVAVSGLASKLLVVIRRDLDVALPAAGGLVGMALMSLLEGNFYHGYPIMVAIVCLATLAGRAGDIGAAPDPIRLSGTPR